MPLARKPIRQRRRAKRNVVQQKRKAKRNPYIQAPTSQVPAAIAAEHVAQIARVTSLSAMVADPCNSPLVPGLYGSAEGMLAKTKKSRIVPVLPTAVCGYLFWNPEFHDDPVAVLPGSSIIRGNIVLWQATDSSLAPDNSIGFPFGNGGLDTTALFLADPASTLVHSDLVADARTVGACLQLRYTGTADNASGELCYFTGLSAQDLLTGGGGNGRLSVDDLFAFATQTDTDRKSVV